MPFTITLTLFLTASKSDGVETEQVPLRIFEIPVQGEI